MPKTTFNGLLAVPSLADLGLVEQRSNEVAQVSFKEMSYTPLTSAILKYQIRDHYDGRFEFWTGQVVSPEFKIRENKPNQRIECISA
jgi:hypothetical protein